MKTFILFLLFMSNSLCAHNNLFLPGDAYFAADLPAKASIVKGKLTLIYESPNNSLMRCGNIGASQIIIEGMDKKTLALLKKFIIRSERSFGGPWGDGFEKGKSTVLIYNKSFDLNKYLPLQKFNENWSKDQQVPATRTSYPGFPDGRLMADDWKYAQQVAPLTTSPSKEQNLKDFKHGRGVIRVQRADIKFIIIPPVDLLKLTKKESHFAFYEIDNEVSAYNFQRYQLTKLKNAQQVFDEQKTVLSKHISLKILNDGNALLQYRKIDKANIDKESLKLLQIEKAAIILLQLPANSPKKTIDSWRTRLEKVGFTHIVMD